VRRGAAVSVSAGISRESHDVGSGGLQPALCIRRIGERRAIGPAVSAGLRGVLYKIPIRRQARLFTRFARNVQGLAAACAVSGTISCESHGEFRERLWSAILLRLGPKRRARPSIPDGRSARREEMGGLFVASRRVFARTLSGLRRTSVRGFDTQHAL
jgi:hypothetical protein